MTLNRKRRRSRLIVITGVIMSLIVGAAIFLLLQGGAYGGETAAIPTSNVVIAVREIPARTTITAEDLALREVPIDATNSQAYISTADVVDRVSAVAIPAGQMLTPNLLASTQSNQGFMLPAPTDAQPGDPPARAGAVLVPDERAVAGSIQPGQRVDIVATVGITPPTEEAGDPASDITAGPSTKVTLQNVTVLARSGEIYILHLDLEQAEDLAEMQAAGGAFTLVLRPEGDEATAETDGSTLAELVEQYGFQLPRHTESDGAGPARTDP